MNAKRWIESQVHLANYISLAEIVANVFLAYNPNEHIIRFVKGEQISIIRKTLATYVWKGFETNGPSFSENLPLFYLFTQILVLLQLPVLPTFFALDPIIYPQPAEIANNSLYKLKSQGVISKRVVGIMYQKWQQGFPQSTENLP